MSDLISRKQAIDTIYANHVSTNPDDFSASEKFIEFMDDTEISSFGRWQWANGFNTALVANKLSIEQLPSSEKTGRWTYTDGKPATIGASYCVICDQCGEESEYCTLFCPNCGAKMEVDGGNNG